MDREEINALLTMGPIEVHMNDGSKHVVAAADQPSCSDISLSFLRRSEDGKWRHVHLPLVTMTRAEASAPTN
ncbi:MAG: hypothetical protein AAGD11_11530 [Planctomycetota bacterium]